MNSDSKQLATYIGMNLYFDLPAGVHPKPGTQEFEELLTTIRSEILRFGERLSKRHRWKGYGHGFMIRKQGAESLAWSEQQDNPDSPEWKR